MPGGEKDAREPKQEGKEEKPKMTEAERKRWIRRKLEETRRERKEASGFQKKLQKALDLRKKAMFGGKFTHGTRGKPTHGPRGNQG